MARLGAVAATPREVEGALRRSARGRHGSGPCPDPGGTGH
jgi:hypothetical protein